MSDEQQYLGDGQDNYGRGVQKAAEAFRTVGETAANTAAAAAEAGATGGKAVSGMATGAAAGGPRGAVLSAAWSFRNTLFKVIVFLCLFLLFIAAAVVSLPSIVTNNVFHMDPPAVDVSAPADISANSEDVSGAATDCIQSGYDMALERVEEIIDRGGYDYDLSMEALVNNGLISADYDTCYTYPFENHSKGFFTSIFPLDHVVL